MKGIDISHYQGTVDFAKVKNTGIEVVYMRATKGLIFKDRLLNTYYKGAKSVGLKIGFYHYLCNNNPYKQAQYFLNATAGLIPDCKYIIDVEETFNQSSHKINRNVMHFANYLKCNGKSVGIYTSTDFYNNYLNCKTKKLPLWIAEYGVSKPSINVKYIGFQYSDKGSVNGINGNVDLDKFNDEIFIECTDKMNCNLILLILYSVY